MANVKYWRAEEWGFSQKMEDCFREELQGAMEWVFDKCDAELKFDDESVMVQYTWECEPAATVSLEDMARTISQHHDGREKEFADAILAAIQDYRSKSD